MRLPSHGLLPEASERHYFSKIREETIFPPLKLTNKNSNGCRSLYIKIVLFFFFLSICVCMFDGCQKDKRRRRVHVTRNALALRCPRVRTVGSKLVRRRLRIIFALRHYAEFEAEQRPDRAETIFSLSNLSDEFTFE